MKPELTQKYLKSIIEYDDLTGEFTWRVRSDKDNLWNSRYSGKKAGSMTSDGYQAICVNDVKYKAHRLAFLYYHGVLPKYIDHIDHDKLNNRISNLRGVVHKENCRNQRMNKNNTSGVTGVYWRRDISKWAAQIMVDGRCIPLGTTKDMDEAIKWRKDAEKLYNFHDNHGESK